MLTAAQMASFHENGYLVLENVLREDDLQPVVEEYSAVIDERARRLWAEGKVSSLYADEPFERRLARLAVEAPEVASELDIMQVRGAATFRFLLNPKVLDIAESLVGGEIVCNPTQHLRAVLPVQQGARPTPWHQDAGVFWPEADPYFILTIWIPLVDATLENGCLEVLPQSHRLGLRRHQMTPHGLTIPPEEIPPGDPVPLPVRRGSVILFHNYTLHRARPNESDTVRWSFDLRYHDAAVPTGRPFYPSFIVRSRLRPATVQDDYAMWRDRWAFALAATPGVKVYRWS
ncbi:MAG: phytanoyl-CoA dioxygenase family protein [Abditibacteriales bacterium]|nr:phytanoyl-CoA dioxygenase family protein [Abditibacteriales bacterium]MDW8364402.1 phytanoyl-CoA dioxygenase family protein [Abditibacteriales bacterium]